MKNLNPFILAFFLTYSISSFSQGNGNQQWKINGNIANENDYIGTKNEIPLKFKTTDIERFRVTPDGLFGIGTSAPEAKLDVNGDVILREHVTLKNLGQSNGLNNDVLLIDGGGNLTRGGMSDVTAVIINTLYGEKNCEPNYQANPTWMNGTKKIFTTCSDVFVGINNNKPRVHLDVVGTAYSKYFTLGNLTPNPDAHKYFHLKTHDGIDNNEKIVQIENNEKELFTIKNNGLVQTKEIETVGNHAIKIPNGSDYDYSVINVRSESGGNSVFNVDAYGLLTSKKIHINSYYDNSVNTSLFAVYNLDRQVFQVNNNGVVRAREIKVDLLTSWPDYVFEKEYILMPIKQVDEFIKTNKHLPKVPNAKTVESEGANLGEMSKLSFEKIEELTLYLIEQDKTIDILKQELEKQNKATQDLQKQVNELLKSKN